MDDVSRSSGSARDAPLRRLFSGDGLQLVGDVRGDPARPPVLFLHGAGQTRASWKAATSDVAAAGWYSVAIDLRGHGDSDWAPDADYSFDAFARDIIAVAGQFERPPVLIGASLGGKASLLAEGEFGAGTASALVLVDFAPRLRLEGTSRVRSFMMGNANGFATLEEAAAAVQAYGGGQRRVNPASLARNLRLDDHGRFHWHWDPRFMQLMASRDAAELQLTEQRCTAAAANLVVPALLVREAPATWSMKGGFGTSWLRCRTLVTSMSPVPGT